MATSHQPLINRPKPSYRKIFSLLFCFVAILSSAALVTIRFARITSFDQICERSVDQKSCSVLLSELVASNKTTKLIKDVDLLQAFLEQSTAHIQSAINKVNKFKNGVNNAGEEAGLADCLELMDSSVDRIMDSMAALQSQDVNSHSNAHSWLSTVLTNHVTCLDGLQGSTKTHMEAGLNDLISRARTSLAIFVSIIPPRKTNTKFIDQILVDGFPSWVSIKDRKLLQALPNEINPNVVVAKDGSGNYKTLKEAVAAAPDKSKTRYIIYVKKGTYKENVEIGKNKKNLMIVGDGMNSTIITGSLNVVDGSTTFNSATVAAVGDGFIAQDIWFQNTAGPEKHQAVALRVGADQSVINRCKVDAYQDTLYAHSNRQFYRDSYVTGTVDFIFGNAAVVFQNCKLVARKPMNSQSNMVTAQGRTDPNQNTATSIQSCNIIASGDLEPVKGSIKSYLGRPWKEYSRTVVMQSHIGDHIDPSGWSVWSGDFALKTLYYGEYKNRGPGSDTSKRVKWAGFHVITSVEEAKQFTVAALIQGGSWLQSTGVTYTEWL
ncbi:Pectinesterase, catalytic [Corchorus olitorius]|uniref:Pectinesterase n=1 Tax=Corchorus olitorius TaxID=93759 RepID=A0A1R3H3L4_9ROSI|nr:Pectinesterase, catalytic [Corchorus olitorius]